MAFPYQVIPGSTLTCLEYQDRIRWEVSNDDCEVTANGRMMPNKESMDVASFCGCQCTICKDGSDVTLPERIVNLGDLNHKTDCATVVNILRLFTPMDCKLFYDATPIDLSSFCGCQPQRQPPSRCSLCGDFFLRDENQVISDTGGLTCGTINDLSYHVIDDGFCQDRIQVLRGVCCSLEPDSPVAAPMTTVAESPTRIMNLPKFVAISNAVHPAPNNYYFSLSSVAAVVVGWSLW
jgi:hypothetical protein